MKLVDKVDLELEEEREGRSRRRRRQKRKVNKGWLKQRYEAGDPEVGLLGDPSGKFDYYVLYPKHSGRPSDPILPPTSSQIPLQY